MRYLRHQTITGCLVAWVLFLSGILSVHAVEHSGPETHQSHSAGMHSDAFCAWMCAAGHVLQTDKISISGVASYVGATDLQSSSGPDLLPAHVCRSRAPPSVTVSHAA